jgi:hypothetical protein
MATLTTKLLLRNDTTAKWTAADPVLSKGEVGVEWTETGVNIKIGNGSAKWSELSYFGGQIVIEGTGNIITDASYSNGILTLTKGKSLVSSITGSANIPTDAAVKSYVDTVVGDAVGGVDSGVISVQTTDDNVINLTPTTATKGVVTINGTHATQGPSTTADTSKGPTAGVTISGSAANGNIVVPRLTVNKYGHVTALSEQTLTITMPSIPSITVESGTAESGKYVSAISSDGHKITVTKASLPTLSKGTATGSGNVITDFSVSGHTITPTKGLSVYTKTEVDNAIAAATNAAVVMRGTLGTNGTITALPTASSTVLGDAYKVVTAGTYANQAAKIGDTFICYTTDDSTYSWMLIPSGDDIEDTWRNVYLDSSQKLGTGTTTGALKFLNTTASGVNVTYDGGFKFDVKTGYTTSDKNYAIEKDGNGNLYVKVPWSDTNDNTAHSHTAGNGLTVTGSGGTSGTVTYSAKAGSGITVTSDGINVNTGYTTSGKNYKVNVDETTGGLYVNVPWTDDDHRDSGYGAITPANSTATTALTGNTTKISAQTYNENVKFSAANKWIVLAGTSGSSAGADELKWGHSLSGVTAGAVGPTADVTGNNNATIVVPQVTVDAAGHVTALTGRTLTLKNTTYSVVTTSANGLAPKAASNGILSANSSGTVAWNSLAVIDGGGADTTTWGVIA